MAITRQGVTAVHMDDAMDEQALRVRAFELAQKNTVPGVSVDEVLADAEKILKFITPETTGTAESVGSTSSGSSSDGSAPKSKLVHFAS